ncbi:hypothetical protein MNBD_ACTINO02-45 [hydrothermal vent metagenome]|uniref:Uncharacterized protein n=1 Tax=hydrothermal vent metagenome TaxID=652676 RepID=A0A3B0SUF4_9ZZZZ
MLLLCNGPPKRLASATAKETHAERLKFDTDVVGAPVPPDPAQSFDAPAAHLYRYGGALS